MRKEPVLVIMAAGMGSRYGGLKQMDKITEAGEIILDFSLYDAYMAGFKKAVIIIKKENEEDFRALIENKAAKVMDIEYAFQDLEDIPEGFEIPEGRVKPWGTGHAVLAARDIIDGPFAVINSDDYYGPGAFKTIYNYLETSEDYCMVAYKIEKTITENGHVSRGVCETDENGYLADINERLKIMRVDGDIAYADGDEWVKIEEGTPVSMNFWGFPGSFMKALEDGFPAFLERNKTSDNPLKGEYLLPIIVGDLLKEDKAAVKVLESSDKWHGVTYKEDKQSVTDALEALKKDGVYPPVLFEDIIK